MLAIGEPLQPTVNLGSADQHTNCTAESNVLERLRHQHALVQHDIPVDMVVLCNLHHLIGDILGQRAGIFADAYTREQDREHGVVAVGGGDMGFLVRRVLLQDTAVQVALARDHDACSLGVALQQLWWCTSQ